MTSHLYFCLIKRVSFSWKVHIFPSSSTWGNNPWWAKTSLSRLHYPTQTQSTRWDFSVQVISPSGNLYQTKHKSHKKNIHIPGGIPTHNLSCRAAADPRLRRRGHWNLHAIITFNLQLPYEICHKQLENLELSVCNLVNLTALFFPLLFRIFVARRWSNSRCRLQELRWHIGTHQRRSTTKNTSSVAYVLPGCHSIRRKWRCLWHLEC
jgi:hypothetical protein